VMHLPSTTVSWCEKVINVTCRPTFLVPPNGSQVYTLQPRQSPDAIDCPHNFIIESNLRNDRPADTQRIGQTLTKFNTFKTALLTYADTLHMRLRGNRRSSRVRLCGYESSDLEKPKRSKPSLL
jgi:hypothetical protein